MDNNSQFLNQISSQLNFDCSVHIDNLNNDDNTIFRSCKSRQCGLCCNFKHDSSFKSTTTNRSCKAKRYQIMCIS